MNAQEVIDIMKIAIAEVEWNYPLDYAIAFEEAIKALEKQIPKKVVFGYDEQDDIYCPVCKFAFATVDDHEYENTFYNYCPHCSQKLDWSDTK